MNTLRPRSAAELGELLRSGPGRVRLHGTSSRQDRWCAAPDAVEVQLAGLDTIHRLDPPDQTCSVDAGVRRSVLDDALERVGLELPCLGTGSLGGLFATDPIGSSTVGGASPRTLLLGMEAVLADGTPFKSGSRVVKSVAGFDVHKLLVGSQGRLFAATRLHLRLRPRPRAEEWFHCAGLDQARALAMFARLRSLPNPPAALFLRRDHSGFAVAGRIGGRPTFVASVLRMHALPVAEPVTELHLDAPSGGEVLMGNVVPSRLPPLLAAAPPTAPFLLHGGGRFELALASPAAADALLAALPNIAHACIVLGAPARRGLGTLVDPGHRRLVDGLKHALDPHDVFV